MGISASQYVVLLFLYQQASLSQQVGQRNGAVTYFSVQEGLRTGISLKRLIPWAWLEVRLANPMGSLSPESRVGGSELLWVWVDLKGDGRKCPFSEMAVALSVIRRGNQAQIIDILAWREFQGLESKPLSLGKKRSVACCRSF